MAAAASQSAKKKKKQDAPKETAAASSCTDADAALHNLAASLAQLMDGVNQGVCLPVAWPHPARRQRS